MIPAAPAPALANERICVYSPSPMFTVTIEDGDAGPDIHFHAGGQGVWVARMIRVLGARPVLCAPFGGESGVVLRTLVEAEGIELRPVDARGSNGGYVHDRRDGKRTELARQRSAQLVRHERDDLYARALVEAIDAGVLVITGPAQEGIVPDDTFRRLAQDASSNGVRVVADLSRGALDALRSGVFVLKVSHEELEGSGLAPGGGAEDLVRGIRELADRGARNVVVSRAHEPALAWVEGRLFELAAPVLEEVDHHGAGDSMTATLAVGVRRGLAIEETLRLAAAAGALNVVRHGLGSGRRETIEAFAKQVELRPLEL